MCVILFIIEEMSHNDKGKQAIYAKAWYERNAEKQKAYSREYSKTHKEERKAYMKVYREKNKTKLLKQQRDYKKRNIPVIAIQRKGYSKDHKDKLAEYQKRYRETLNGKAAHNRGQALRERDLGFIPLNSYFEGSEGHHITHNFVVHIPTYMHKSIWHNINSSQGTEAINKIAICFLLYGI